MEISFIADDLSDIPSDKEGTYGFAGRNSSCQQRENYTKPGCDVTDAIMDKIDKELDTMTRLKVNHDVNVKNTLFSHQMNKYLYKNAEGHHIAKMCSKNRKGIPTSKLNAFLCYHWFIPLGHVCTVFDSIATFFDTRTAER